MLSKIKNIFFKNWEILLIIFLTVLIRVYRLPYLITFGGDQGRDLLVVKRMIVEHKYTLLGPKTSVLPIYHGPIYYYLIFPVLYFSDLNPLSISYFMIFLWTASFYLTYLLGKGVFNKNVGLLSALFFAIWPLGVEYSRQAFSAFPTPFFAALFLYSLWIFLKGSKYIWIFIAGLSFGVMMQLHYFNFFLGVFCFIYFLVKKRITLRLLFLFTVGFVLTLSPMILFEFRHQFFNTKTLLFSLSNNGVGNFKFQPHYFIAFFPIVFIVLGYILDKILRKNRIIGSIIIIILITINLFKLDLNRNSGFTMPDGWNYLGVKKASEIIAQDALGDFNVAAILDGDTRGYSYRYIIETKGKKPLDVEDYNKNNILYVVAKSSSQDVINYPVWEIQTILPAKITKEWNIQNGIKVFKIEKK